MISGVSVKRVLQFLDRCSLVSPLPVSFPYPGLTVPTLPGGLASLSLPGATRLGFPPLPAGVCVLLISNLNPEVGPSLCFFRHLLVVHHHPAGPLKSAGPLTFDLMLLFKTFSMFFYVYVFFLFLQDLKAFETAQPNVYLHIGGLRYILHYYIIIFPCYTHKSR